MAKSIIYYTGDGTTTTYPVTFDLGFIHRDHVIVADELGPLNFTWLSDTQIELAAPPMPGEQFYIQRITPQNELVNDYTDKAILRGKNLNDSLLQTLMILEEREDDEGGTKYGLRSTTPVNRLPDVADRANMLLSFDSAGHPITVVPESQSAGGVLLDLKDNTNLTKGVSLIGRSVVAVDSIAELSTIPESSLDVSGIYLVSGYYPGTMVGGGEFRWDSSSTEAINGVTVVATSGIGRFIRVVRDGCLTPEMAGAESGEEATAACQLIADLCHSGDTLLYTFKTLPGTTFQLSSDLNLRRIRLECAGEFEITNSSSMVLVGGRAQNSNNPKQVLNRVRRSVPADAGVPDIRIIGAKNQEISIERAGVVQVWASTVDANLDGSSAYSSFWIKYVTELNLDTDPDTSGGTTQWINENTFYLGRCSEVNVRGSYSHNNNKFYNGSFENSAVINFEVGASNVFYGVRLEGSGNQVSFADGTYGNKVIQSWQPNQNSNAEFNVNATVTNNGRSSNHVCTQADSQNTTIPIYSTSITSPWTTAQLPSAAYGFNTQRRRGVIGYISPARTLGPCLHAPITGVAKGDVLTAAVDSGSYGWYLRFFDADMKPCSITHSNAGNFDIITPLSFTAHGSEGNALVRTAGNSSITFEINSTIPKFVSVAMIGASSISNTTAKHFKLVKTTSNSALRGTLATTNSLPHTPNLVDGPPNEGWAPVGHKWQDINGDQYLCVYSYDTVLSAGAVATDTTIFVDSSYATEFVQYPMALSGANVGDIIGIQADDIQETHWTTISAVNSGTGEITLDDALVDDSSAGVRVVILRWITIAA